MEYFLFLVFVHESNRCDIHFALVVGRSSVQTADQRSDRIDRTPVLD